MNGNDYVTMQVDTRTCECEQVDEVSMPNKVALPDGHAPQDEKSTKTWLLIAHACYGRSNITCVNETMHGENFQ